MYCKVLYCRYPNFHTTSGHKCGTCGKFGHGQMECGNNIKINNLVPYLNNVIPKNKQCTVINCRYKFNHMKESHLCDKCNRRHFDECIIQNLDFHKNKFDMLNDFDISSLENYNNIYVQLYVGMGCYVYIRKKENIILSLFMHSDSWGQYGEDSNDEPVLQKFIENLQELNFKNLESSNSIKCPICRSLNTMEDILEIKGSSEKCVCCLTNDIQIYLAKCKHACLCNECIVKIRNN